MPDSSASDDRLIYAGFPQALREAMRLAAKRFDWVREDWQMQTAMIHEAITDGRCSADEIASAYAVAPPGAAA